MLTKFFQYITKIFHNYYKILTMIFLRVLTKNKRYDIIRLNMMKGDD